MSLDLEAALRAAVCAPVLEELRTLRAELAGLRMDLARAGDSLLDDKGAAEHVGLTVAAFRARARRESDLVALALGGERFRRWRRADLDGYLTARQRAAARRGGR